VKGAPSVGVGAQFEAKNCGFGLGSGFGQTLNIVAFQPVFYGTQGTAHSMGAPAQLVYGVGHAPTAP